jgi:hypothetical protein
MKKQFIIIIVLFISQFSFGQILPHWVATYGGNPNLDYWLNDMATDNAGNSYVYGYEEDTAYHQTGIIIKYNADGIQEWLNTYNDLGPYGKIKIDKDGNVYIISRIGGLSFSYDYLTIKYNSNGNLKWTAVYNGTDDFTDMPHAISFDDSLNVYVTGEATGIGTGYDYATVKYDSSGTQKWVSTYDNNHNYGDRAYAITVDSLHNVYVTGASFDTTNGSLLTIKYNSSGNQVWAKRFFGDYFSSGLFIELSADNYLYVGGIDSYEDGGCDYLCIKYDTSGNKIWSSEYNAQDSLPWNGEDAPRAMKLDKAGNVFFTGTQYNGNGINDDYCTVKFNNDGVLQWAKSYNGGTGWDDAYSLDLDNQGNVYVVGQSQDNVYNQQILTTIKYDSAGNVSWIAKFCTAQTENYLATSIGLDSLNNIYVSGLCLSNSSHFITMQYSNVTGINEEQNSTLFSVYPNPFNELLILDIGHIQNENYVFKLYNLMGQLVQEIDNIDSNKQEIECKSLIDGIYFYQILNSKGKVAGGKLIKM